MLRHFRTRRRPHYGAPICAFLAAVLLLLSVSLLHSRLTFFSSQAQLQHLPFSQDSLSLNPLVDDLESYPFITSYSNDDRIDELDDAVDSNNSSINDEVEAEEEEEESNQNPGSPYNYFFDHVNGVVRRSYNKHSIEEWEDYVPFNTKLRSDLGLDGDNSKAVFGSDDILVDEKLRNKLSEVKKLEDALLLKGSVLREGWGEWFDKKADFLRRDRMFKSNIEVLNPMNNPILQDPDGAGVTGLTRSDKMFQKALLNEFKKNSFLIKKPLAIFDSRNKGSRENFNSDLMETRRIERKDLGNNNGSGLRSLEGLAKVLYADGKRWGYYPGLDGMLPFVNFMEAFFNRERCRMKIFMVWNSPAWMFGVRQQRGLESLLYHHKDACVVVFSETIELNFFIGFLKDGFKVAVVMPNLDELFKDTPTHIFASVWHEWKKTKYYPTHYSELVRLAALYKYGGIYLDSDVIVLRPLSQLNNTVGMEDTLSGKTLNGAVMAFRKHSPFIMECLREFYGSYDDKLLGWNGADLLTRVADKFLSNKDTSDEKMELQLLKSSLFFPINRSSISRYFSAPQTDSERFKQDIMFKKILEQSVTFHFWNSLTAALIPEPNSLVSRLLYQYCIHCSDVL